MTRPLLLGTCLLLLAGGARTAAASEDPAAAAGVGFPRLKPGRSIDLPEALRLADRRNLTLAQARTEIRKAQATLESAWATLLPVASGSLIFTHYDHADTAEIGSGQSIETRRQQDLRGGLKVEMPIVNAQAWLGVRLGRTGVRTAELQLEQVRQQLLLVVAQAYFEALTARSLIEVQQEQIKSSRRHLAIADIRHRSGTGNRLDTIRAQTELLAAQEELLKAHTALNDARDALAELIGVEGLPLPVEAPSIVPPRSSEKELVDRAGRQREEIKVSQALTELADQQLDLSWMRFVPSLYASWQLSQQLTEPNSFGSPDKSRWYIGLTLAVPIYDHTRYAELHQQRAAVAQTRLAAEDTRRQIALEVRRTRRSYERAMELVATAQQKARLADQAVKLTESAYENGTGSSLDVTDARRTNRAAAIDLATKRFGAQLALLGLLRSVGEDLRKISGPATSAPSR